MGMQEGLRSGHANVFRFSLHRHERHALTLKATASLSSAPSRRRHRTSHSHEARPQNEKRHTPKTSARKPPGRQTK
jgi:hypothetical protein